MAMIGNEPIQPPVNVQYERGIAIDRNNLFVAAYQWEKGTPRPRLNPKGTPEEKKLTWLTMPEALADPKENGKWDEENLVWLLPDTPAYEVLERVDKPGYWTLQGKSNVWPERLPSLREGRKWVMTPPPETRAQRPIWSDSAGAWLLPQPRMIVDAEGFCVNLVGTLTDGNDIDVPAGGRVVDPDAITVTDELGETRALCKGDKLNPDDTVVYTRPPNYKKVPVPLLEQVLQDTGNLAAFKTFIEGKGFTVEQVRGLETISLNNKHLREFVLAQGYTLKQAYNALQRAAETMLEQETQTYRTLGEIE